MDAKVSAGAGTGAGAGAGAGAGTSVCTPTPTGDTKTTTHVMGIVARAQQVRRCDKLFDRARTTIRVLEGNWPSVVPSAPPAHVALPAAEYADIRLVGEDEWAQWCLHTFGAKVGVWLPEPSQWQQYAVAAAIASDCAWDVLVYLVSHGSVSLSTLRRWFTTTRHMATIAVAIADRLQDAHDLPMGQWDPVNDEGVRLVRATRSNILHRLAAVHLFWLPTQTLDRAPTMHMLLYFENTWDKEEVYRIICSEGWFTACAKVSVQLFQALCAAPAGPATSPPTRMEWEDMYVRALQDVVHLRPSLRAYVEGTRPAPPLASQELVAIKTAPFNDSARREAGIASPALRTFTTQHPFRDAALPPEVEAGTTQPLWTVAGRKAALALQQHCMPTQLQDLYRFAEAHAVVMRDMAKDGSK